MSWQTSTFWCHHRHHHWFTAAAAFNKGCNPCRLLGSGGGGTERGGGHCCARFHQQQQQRSLIINRSLRSHNEMTNNWFLPSMLQRYERRSLKSYANAISLEKLIEINRFEDIKCDKATDINDNITAIKSSLSSIIESFNVRLHQIRSLKTLTSLSSSKTASTAVTLTKTSTLSSSNTSPLLLQSNIDKRKQQQQQQPSKHVTSMICVSRFMSIFNQNQSINDRDYRSKQIDVVDVPNIFNDRNCKYLLNNRNNHHQQRHRHQLYCHQQQRHQHSHHRRSIQNRLNCSNNSNSNSLLKMDTFDPHPHQQQFHYYHHLSHSHNNHLNTRHNHQLNHGNCHLSKHQLSLSSSASASATAYLADNLFDNHHHHHHKQYNDIPTAYTLAIERLNRLQSNAEYLRNASATDKPKSLEKTRHFLRALNINDDDLDRLNVIHVAGTKGKGSTCAFIEAILRRNYGYRTGFYSSPHLVVVRERIRIDGHPISEDKFAKYFHHVYEVVEAVRTDEYRMPGYFNFLTILAFYVFIHEHVDVAVIEVGIGGRYDCTNVVRKPLVTAVTSLDYDHCRLLGNTLAEIGANKAGIFKPQVPALTIEQQPPEAMEALKSRAKDLNIPLLLAPAWSEYSDSASVDLGIKGNAQQLNASLAVQCVHLWLKRMKSADNFEFPVTNGHDHHPECIHLSPVPLSEYRSGLATTKWPGRCETITVHRNLVYCLDSAHTQDSMDNCCEWFGRQIIDHSINGQKLFKIFVFNCTGDRDSRPLLAKTLPFNFDYVIFTTNRLYRSDKKLDSDHSNLTITTNYEDDIRQKNYENYHQLTSESSMANNPRNIIQTNCIEDTIKQINFLHNQITADDDNVKLLILICGSVHLVGGFINLLNPNFVN